MEWYAKVLSQYFDFNGRARRKEYWMFGLFNAIVAFCFGFVVGLMKLPPQLAQLYTLGTLIPGFAVAVRRMHDTGHSGWFLLVPFYNLYLLVTEGEKKPNHYGPDPKGSEPQQSSGKAA